MNREQVQWEINEAVGLVCDMLCGCPEEHVPALLSHPSFAHVLLLAMQASYCIEWGEGTGQEVVLAAAGVELKRLVARILKFGETVDLRTDPDDIPFDPDPPFYDIGGVAAKFVAETRKRSVPLVTLRDMVGCSRCSAAERKNAIDATPSTC
jgi:hypothetical protein